MKVRNNRAQVKRNPMAFELVRNPLYRPRIEASAATRLNKADGFSRRAKHKIRVRRED